MAAVGWETRNFAWTGMMAECVRCHNAGGGYALSRRRSRAFSRRAFGAHLRRRLADRTHRPHGSGCMEGALCRGLAARLRARRIWLRAVARGAGGPLVSAAVDAVRHCLADAAGVHSV